MTIKISGDEYIKGGLSLHEMIEIAKRAEAAGIDGIMVSAGTVGEEALIRPCIACNEGCYKRIFQQLDIQCGTNPTLGRDDAILCKKTTDPQCVVVVGAGPGGVWKRPMRPGKRGIAWN